MFGKPICLSIAPADIRNPFIFQHQVSNTLMLGCLAIAVVQEHAETTPDIEKILLKGAILRES
jgi:hypothetical protein